MKTRHIYVVAIVVLFALQLGNAAPLDPSALFATYGYDLELLLFEAAQKLLIGWNKFKLTASCTLLPSGDTEIRGTVNFTQVGLNGSVTIEGTVTGLTPGYHGFHVHQFGDLSNACSSAGPHFNPIRKQHGAPQDTERHVGDLGNIVADSSGVAKIRKTDNVIKLFGPTSIIGRSCMVHANRDDLGRGDGDSHTTGNAGGRVACGIIGITSS